MVIIIITIIIVIIRYYRYQDSYSCQLIGGVGFTLGLVNYWEGADLFTFIMVIHDLDDDGRN